MAIANEIATLKTNITNAYNSINTKGGTIPTNKNTENLSSAIDSIPSGGGDVSDYFTTPLVSGGLANPTYTYSYTSGINASLLKIPANISFSSYDSATAMFRGCKNLVDCSSLVTANTSVLRSMNAMFQWCNSLKTVPLFDTSNVVDMSNTFSECISLTSVPLFNTSKVTKMASMFSNCSKLLEIPNFDTSNVTNMYAMFLNCSQITTIPELNTGKVENFQQTFQNCSKLEILPLLNCQSCTNIYSIFSSANNITTLGGFQNLGQAYKTTQSANYSYYKLDLSKQTKLTEQSLINVLNNLYDIATAGCNTQTVTLGATNLAKLTSTEGQQALASAQSKGWNIN